MADDAASRLAELEAAYASGVLTVRHGALETTFRSLTELERAIARLRAASGLTTTRLRYPVQSTKAL